MTESKCQLRDKDSLHIGKPKPVLLSFGTRLAMTLAAPLNADHKRLIKKFIQKLTPRPAKSEPAQKVHANVEDNLAIKSLTKGDIVRIRSVNEIQATLNSKGRYKGCKFMLEMEQYCGTIQRVFKPVDVFMNERDFTMRRSNGLVLLENLYCEGFSEVGRCDRSCFYFWRVEWLEKIEDNKIS